LWRSFIYPSLRLDYQGRPLKVTKDENAMPDERWYYDNPETCSSTKQHLTHDMKA
jgi:hypothetical protein